MRRILIDSAVEARAKEFADVMTGNRPDKLDWGKSGTPKEKLIAFYKELIKRPDYIDCAKYVYHVIILYENLLMLPPESFATLYEDYFQKWDCVLDCDVDYGKSKKFYEHVIDCMGYAKIRSGLMRQYMKEQRIKTCVYCNAQYAITTEEFEEMGKKKRIGTYQFDHNWPESLFPFLCTSYYNLLPSCPTCNQTKLQRKAEFNLYTKRTDELDVFRFVLTPDKAAIAYVSDDMDKLEVKLNCDKNTVMLKNHQDLFHIDYIYAEHLDVVKRIIILLRNNDGYYQQSLRDSVPELLPNGVEDPGYFFFGYYMEKKNIHMQPLSKLVQDLVAEMKC